MVVMVVGRGGCWSLVVVVAAWWVGGLGWWVGGLGWWVGLVVVGGW